MSRSQISIGQTVTEVTSTDNSDLSEKEFRDNQTTDDGIAAAPKDFSEVSPESIGVRVKLDAAPDFLNGLKGQEVEVSLNSLIVSCDALRAGEQTINISVDPDRAAGMIAKFKSLPGVVAAVELDDVVDAVAEQVGRLALAFVAPLGADQNDGGHRGSPSVAGLGITPQSIGPAGRSRRA